MELQVTTVVLNLKITSITQKKNEMAQTLLERYNGCAHVSKDVDIQKYVVYDIFDPWANFATRMEQIAKLT